MIMHSASIVADMTRPAGFYVSEWPEHVHRWVFQTYGESPALVLGLAVALALPTVAVVGWLAGMAVNYRSARVEDEPPPKTIPASPWRQRARFVFDPPDRAPFRIDRPLTRIGREADNDLCLTHPTVHRYHAVLERTPDAHFIITDLGNPRDPDVLVNGAAVSQQRLRGGEVLEFGDVRLRFEIGSG